MWVLINTLTKQSNTIGKVISIHYTEVAANKANKCYQKKNKVFATNNKSIPTLIVKVDKKISKNVQILPTDIIEISKIKFL